MLPIYANCCHGVSIGCVYGFFGAVDNHGISWQESHKKLNKMCFCRGFESSAALSKLNFLTHLPRLVAGEDHLHKDS